MAVIQLCKYLKLHVGLAVAENNSCSVCVQLNANQSGKSTHQSGIVQYQSYPARQMPGATSAGTSHTGIRQCDSNQQQQQ